MVVAVGLPACRASSQGGAGSAVTVAGRGGDDSSRTTRVTSNILRGDYAGSAACVPCHAKLASAWGASPMHRMTRLPEQTDVRAPFDGRAFHFKDDVARFTQVGDARFVTLRSALGPTPGVEHVYRVTKVIGGRYREDFAGVEVAGATPGAPLVGDARAELLLPASYVFETGTFRLKGYSVMVGERPGLRAGGVWNQTCIFCHNTVPYFDDLWGALSDGRHPSYQGEVVDRALPPDRRVGYRVADPDALLRALDDELAVLGAGPGAATRSARAGAGSGGDGEAARAALRRAILEARERFVPAHFVEVGIGCEACHGGAREHADDPNRLPTFEPRSPLLRLEPPPGANGPLTAAEWQNRACARCHQVLFSRYPRTWEGGQRRELASAGGSSITSGEARDFLLGKCGRQMACSTCHDPHREDDRAALAALATPAGNHVCTTCHAKYTAPEALRAHAHHDPMGAGGSCVACHMPKKNMGLSYALNRYHRIGSPTDAARVEHDRPLECALCHADKTVRALLDDMQRFWGKTYDQASLRGLYGSLDANVFQATLERGMPHEQAVVIGTVAAGATAATGGQAGVKTSASAAANGNAVANAAATTTATGDVSALRPLIARQLTNPIVLVRYFARDALERVDRGAGRPACAIDLDRPSAEIAAAAAGYLRGCATVTSPGTGKTTGGGADWPAEPDED